MFSLGSGLNTQELDGESFSQRQCAALICSVLIISVCSIVYELLLSALSSYFWGNSITHFSITIGLFMFFMGVGSYLSRFVQHKLLQTFLTIEVAIGLVGGFAAAILYWGFAVTEYYYVVAFLLIAIISILIGLEIPLVTRLVETRQQLREVLAQVLAVDYLGALIASLLFPFVLLPYFGIVKTSFLIGMLNLAVASYLIVTFRPMLKEGLRGLVLAAVVSLLGLSGGLWYSFELVSFFERFIYEDEIILAQTSPYQRIVLTRFNDDLRLFLSGNLQFSSRDERRYHEPLVHLPMLAAKQHESVLLLGAGDGLAVREILKYPEVKHITVVDLDPQVVELAQTHPLLRELNEDSLLHPKVRVIFDDAFRFLQQTSDLYDVIIADLPDPSDVSLAKLYSLEFYHFVERHLARGGVAMTQSGSPYYARKAFWCISASMKEAFPFVTPLKHYVPSFGMWGYQLASRHPLDLSQLPVGDHAHLIKAPDVKAMEHFPPDMAALPVEAQRLDSQVLLQYYQESLNMWHD